MVSNCRTRSSASSSISMSLSRRTRKKPPPLYSKPGNRRMEKRRISCSSRMKRWCSPGRRMKRSNLPGSSTRPARGSPPPRSSSSATPMPVFGMKGKGCAGWRVSVPPCFSKWAASRSCCFFMPSVPLTRGPMSQSCFRYVMARSASNGMGFTSAPPAALSWANPSRFGGAGGSAGVAGGPRLPDEPGGDGRPDRHRRRDHPGRSGHHNPPAATRVRRRHLSWPGRAAESESARPAGRPIRLPSRPHSLT